MGQLRPEGLIRGIWGYSWVVFFFVFSFNFTDNCNLLNRTIHFVLYSRHLSNVMTDHFWCIIAKHRYSSKYDTPQKFQVTWFMLCCVLWCLGTVLFYLYSPELASRANSAQPKLYWKIWNNKQVNLTRLPLVPHICVNKLGHHWSRYRFVACLAPSHYLN